MSGRGARSTVVGVNATVAVSSELPIPAGTVAELVTRPALMRHVLWPIITFPDLPEEYDVEHGVTVGLSLFGVLPLWRHAIRVVEADRDAFVAVTEEHGGPVRRWRHRLTAVPLDDDRCRYTDEVEIDAGALTVVARLVANGLYTYRHRRWRALARVLARPTVPR